MGILLVIILIICVFYQIYKLDKVDREREEHNRKNLYKEWLALKEKKDPITSISEPDENDNRITEIEVDEYIGKVYNLVKDRIGQKNCTFLSPIADNSEFIELLQQANQKLPFQTNFLTSAEIEEKLNSLDFSQITEFTEAKKSGEKGKNYFINKNNEPSTTEEIAKEYYSSIGYIVLRAELDFWQMLFCLLFFEEIYCKHWDVLSDIPFDYFYNSFYFMREELIKSKLEKISKCDRLKYFITSQYNDFGRFHSRLLYPTGKSFDVSIFDFDEITKVFDYIPNEDIVKIMSRYAQNPSAYRSGMPDLLMYNENGYQLVEVKRFKEKIRNEQADWISYMQDNNIPVKIIRVKGN